MMVKSSKALRVSLITCIFYFLFFCCTITFATTSFTVPIKTITSDLNLTTDTGTMQMYVHAFAEDGTTDLSDTIDIIFSSDDSDQPDSNDGWIFEGNVEILASDTLPNSWQDTDTQGNPVNEPGSGCGEGYFINDSSTNFNPYNGSDMIKIGSHDALTNWNIQNKIEKNFPATNTQQTLNFAFNMWSYDYGDFDRFSVGINDSQTIIYEKDASFVSLDSEPPSLDSSGWQVVSIDLSPWIGNNPNGFTIWFSAGETEDECKRTRTGVFLDSISIDSGSPASVWYYDFDGDGYGNPSDSIISENQLAGYVADNTDCDDNDASIHPGAAEIDGDALDNDCDGTIDEATSNTINSIELEGDGWENYIDGNVVFAPDGETLETTVSGVSYGERYKLFENTSGMSAAVKILSATGNAYCGIRSYIGTNPSGNRIQAQIWIDTDGKGIGYNIRYKVRERDADNNVVLTYADEILGNTTNGWAVGQDLTVSFNRIALDKVEFSITSPNSGSLSETVTLPFSITPFAGDQGPYATFFTESYTMSSIFQAEFYNVTILYPDEIVNSITIESNLSFTLSDAIYTSVFGDMNLWANFTYFGDQGGNLLWELADFEITTSAENPITINSDLSFSFDGTYSSPFGDMDLTLNFKYFGEQDSKLLWELDSYTVE